MGKFRIKINFGDKIGQVLSGRSVKQIVLKDIKEELEVGRTKALDKIKESDLSPESIVNLVFDELIEKVEDIL